MKSKCKCYNLKNWVLCKGYGNRRKPSFNHITLWKHRIQTHNYDGYKLLLMFTGTHPSAHTITWIIIRKNVTNIMAQWFTLMLVPKWLHCIFYEGLTVLRDKKLFHSERCTQIAGYTELYVHAICLHPCMNKAVCVKLKASWSSLWLLTH